MAEPTPQTQILSSSARKLNGSWLASSTACLIVSHHYPLILFYADSVTSHAYCQYFNPTVLTRFIHTLHLARSYHQRIQASCGRRSVLGSERSDIRLRLPRCVCSHHLPSFCTPKRNQGGDSCPRGRHEPVFRAKCHLRARSAGYREEVGATSSTN